MVDETQLDFHCCFSISVHPPRLSQTVESTTFQCCQFILGVREKRQHDISNWMDGISTKSQATNLLFVVVF